MDGAGLLSRACVTCVGATFRSRRLSVVTTGDIGLGAGPGQAGGGLLWQADRAGPGGPGVVNRCCTQEEPAPSAAPWQAGLPRSPGWVASGVGQFLVWVPVKYRGAGAMGEGICPLWKAKLLPVRSEGMPRPGVTRLRQAGAPSCQHPAGWAVSQAPCPLGVRPQPLGKVQTVAAAVGRRPARSAPLLRREQEMVPQ